MCQGLRYGANIGAVHARAGSAGSPPGRGRGRDGLCPPILSSPRRAARNHPEAQEAREGLFRIAEWRWGEARVATAGMRPTAAARRRSRPKAHRPRPRPPPPSRRAASASTTSPTPDRRPPTTRTTAGRCRSGQAAANTYSRDRGRPARISGAYHPRFQIGKFLAHALSGVGWIALLTGIFEAISQASSSWSANCRQSACSACRSASCWACPPWCWVSCSSSVDSLPPRCFASANANLELVAVERRRASFSESVLAASLSAAA